MRIAVVGGDAWFTAALSAALDTGAGAATVETAGRPRDLSPCVNGGTRIAILADEIGRDRLGATIAAWRRAMPELRVVVRLKALRAALVREAMQAGAWGCFSGEDGPETVLTLLRSVASGRMSFPYVDLTELAESPFERLTRREREVLEALSKGWTNTQISTRLGVSENTVKYHLKLIYDKLGVQNRATAVARFLNHSM